MRMFCQAAPGTVPAAITSVKAQKYQSTKADWSSSTDNTVGWQCLKFSIDEPQYYMYQYTGVGTDANAGSFTANAFGDLNGDGVESTFSVMGSSLNGVVTISPNVQETNPEE
jgi:type IV pilus assembly protein PilA